MVLPEELGLQNFSVVDLQLILRDGMKMMSWKL